MTRRELKKLARTLSDGDWRFLAAEHDDWSGKRLGFKKPANEAERRLLRAGFKGETEPCCECGEDYPRADLIIDSEIYCRKCRKKP